MGDPLQASNAWAMGNLGLSTVLRDEPDVSSYDDEDLGEHDAPRRRGSCVSAAARSAGRWSPASFLAFVNHWPGGH